jgi:tRNA dimethylallyltransferase
MLRASSSLISVKNKNCLAGLFGRLCFHRAMSSGSPMTTTHITKPQVIILAGSTGIGKSDVAALLCKDRGVIVSADSVQSYKNVRIGANKPDETELSRTPHLLIDIAGHTENYHAGDWMNDCLFAIKSLTLTDSGVTPEEGNSERRKRLLTTIDSARVQQGFKKDQVVLPVVVGGTMMYLDWLVYGQPKAVPPSETAEKRAEETINVYETAQDWEGAKDHARSLNKGLIGQIDSLFKNDYYRLRRVFEVGYTVEEIGDESLIHKMYNGGRHDGLLSLGYDVRCFFLCPEERKAHCRIIDQRCEGMLMRGLLRETTDLVLAGEIPEMVTKSIGYRQALDYLGREGAQMNDREMFDSFLNDFAASTRRYANKQVKWFRKDSAFLFVPVNPLMKKEERAENTAHMINRFISMSRDDFDKERFDESSISMKTKAENEKQGKLMRSFMWQKQILRDGTSFFDQVMQEADDCTNRFQAKRRKSPVVATDHTQKEQVLM